MSTKVHLKITKGKVTADETGQFKDQGGNFIADLNGAVQFKNQETTTEFKVRFYDINGCVSSANGWPFIGAPEPGNVLTVLPKSTKSLTLKNEDAYWKYEVVDAANVAQKLDPMIIVRDQQKTFMPSAETLAVALLAFIAGAVATLWFGRSRRRAG